MQNKKKKKKEKKLALLRGRVRSVCPYCVCSRIFK